MSKITPFAVTDGTHTQVLSTAELADEEYMLRLARAGFRAAPGSNRQVPRLFYQDIDGNWQSKARTLDEHMNDLAAGTYGRFIPGELGAELDSAVRQEQVRRELTEESVLPAPVEMGVAALRGAGRALSFGATDYLGQKLGEAIAGEDAQLGTEMLQGMDERRAGSAFVGELAGFLLPYAGVARGAGTLARFTPGGLSRTAGAALGGRVGALARARLGQNSMLASALEAAGTAVAEDVVSSASYDISQVVAGKEDFNAEQILANAGSSAMLGLGIEGSVRGLGALGGLVGRAMGRGARGLLAHLDDGSRGALKQLEVDDAMRALDDGDTEAVARYMQSYRDEIASQDSFAMAMRNAPEAVDASKNLDKLADSITKDITGSVTASREAVEGQFNRAARDMLHKGRPNQEWRKTFVAIDAPKLRNQLKFAGSVQGAAGKLDKQAVQILDRMTAAVKNSGGKRALDHLLDAQDELTKLRRKSPELAEVALTSDSKFARVETAIQEQLAKALSPEGLQIRQLQQEAADRLHAAADGFAGAAKFKSTGELIDLETFKADSKKLRRTFKEMKHEDLGSHFDGAAKAFVELREVGKLMNQVSPGVGDAIIMNANSGIRQMLEAYKSASLVGAMNSIRAGSDDAGKMLATFRSVRGLVGGSAGSVLGTVALGPLGGVAAGIGGAMLARPISMVHAKAWLEKALNGNFSKFSMGLGKAKRALSGSRVAITHSYAQMSRLEKQKAFERDWEQVQQFTQYPADIVDSLAEQTSGLVDVHYPLAQAVQASVVRKQAYLAQVIPQPLVDPLFPERITMYPSETQLDDYLARREVADDPFRLLDHFAAGTISPAMVETVQFVYPEAYADMVTSLSELVYSVAQKDKLDYKQRVRLQLSFGIRTDHTTDGSFIALMQSTLAQTEEQANTIGGSRGAPSTRKMALTEQSMPVTARIGD